jgi:hypothetical protein
MTTFSDPDSVDEAAELNELKSPSEVVSSSTSPTSCPLGSAR